MTKKAKNTLREAKKEADRRANEAIKERDSEGRVIINMTVKDDANFLSVFSENDTPVIANDVADFIESSASSVVPGELLTLRIHSDCIDEQEQTLYRKATKEFFTQKYIANERELKRNALIVLTLTLLGIFVLAFRVIFEYRTGSAIWSEVIDIMAWVFLWEAVDIGVFGSRSLKMKRLRYISLISMNIEYV